MAVDPTIRYVSKSDAIAIVRAAKAAYTNQNAIAKIKVGETIYTADAAQSQIEMVAGNNVALSVENGVITFSATDTTYANVEADATGTKASGLMTSRDKDKLDKISEGAEVNQNAFSNVKVGAETLAADAKTDTFELAGGSNITLSVTGDVITIAATDTTYTLTQDANDGHKLVFTPSNGQPVEITIPDSDTTYSDVTADATGAAASGLMASDDKDKLDKIADGAQVNVIEGIKVGDAAVTLTDKVATLGTAAGAAVASSVANDANLPTGAAVQTYVTGLGYQTSTDVENAINTKIATAMDWKGAKEDMDALEAVANPKNGDVYHVTSTGSEYAWNGSAWEELGVTFDASGYVEETDLGGLTAAELAEVIAEL